MNRNHVKVKGVEFASLKEASEAYSLPPATVQARINKLGWSIEEALGISERKPSKTAPKKIILEGVQYTSIAEAARKLSKDYNKISLRINRGWSTEEAFDFVKRRKNQPIEVTIGDKTYGTISEASNALGVKTSRVRDRLQMGWSIEEALGISERKISKTAPKKIVLKGVEYPSIQAASKKFGIPQFKVYGRMRKGWTIEESLGLKIRKKSKTAPKIITIDGINYPNRSEAARAFNLKPNLVNSRLNAGWTPEEAVEIVARNNGHPNAYGVVYLITNRINGKKYVGVTMSTLEKRWEKHIKKSRSGRFTKHSLQAAIAEFGQENFDRKIVETALNQDDLALKEISWVDKEETKYPKGYNLTRGGGGIDTKGEAITVEGVEYPSIVKAAEAYKLPYSLVITRLKTNNWSVEESFEIDERSPSNAPKKIILKGVEYSSLKEAADEYELCHKKISDRLIKGWSVEEAFEFVDKDYKGKPKTIIVNNRCYCTLAEAARELGVQADVVRYRVKAGWTMEEAFNLEQRVVERPSPANGLQLTVEGVQYPNITKAAEAYELDYNLIYNRLSSGWSVEEAFNLVSKDFRPATSKEITVKGESFPTIKEAALHFGLDPAVVRSRLNTLNWPIEKAFELS